MPSRATYNIRGGSPRARSHGEERCQSCPAIAWSGVQWAGSHPLGPRRPGVCASGGHAVSDSIRRFLPRLSRVAALGVLVASLGCSPGLTVKMFNRSADSLVYVVWGVEYGAPVSGVVEFPLATRMEVRSSTRCKEYLFPQDLIVDQSREYIEVGFFVGRRVKMESRSDDSIYILPASGSPNEARPDGHQRKGFPLHPTSACPSHGD